MRLRSPERSTLIDLILADTAAKLAVNEQVCLAHPGEV